MLQVIILVLNGSDWRKRGAGYFLPGVWECPPAFKSPPKLGGYRGLIENISACSYNRCTGSSYWPLRETKDTFEKGG